MLAEGRLQSAKLTGYVEADFLSAGVTSNNNQSNSYTLRQRQAWGQAAFDSGWSFTGGQMWSLVTETKHGMDNRTEALPMTIDPQYTVGFSWARQYGRAPGEELRQQGMVRGVGGKSAGDAHHPQQRLQFPGRLAGAGGGLYNSAVTNCSTTINSSTGGGRNHLSPAANYAFNPSPDVVAKLAFEPGFGHYEIFGVYSRFRDRIFPCEDIASTTLCGGSAKRGSQCFGAYNSSKNGGGFGANARWSFAHKHVDFGLHGFGGSGVGRYGTGGLPDISVRANGTLDLVRSLQGWRRWSSTDSKAGYLFQRRSGVRQPRGGLRSDHEKISSVTDRRHFNNSGCYTETGPGGGRLPAGRSCQLHGGHARADRRNCGRLVQTVRWLEGEVELGPHPVRSAVLLRDSQRLVGCRVPGEPHGIDNMVFTSFRYYLP